MAMEWSQAMGLLYFEPGGLMEALNGSAELASTLAAAINWAEVPCVNKTVPFVQDTHPVFRITIVIWRYVFPIQVPITITTLAPNALLPCSALRGPAGEHPQPPHPQLQGHAEQNEHAPQRPRHRRPPLPPQFHPPTFARSSLLSLLAGWQATHRLGSPTTIGSP